MTDLVLVVDDSSHNLLVATRHLETAGYRVANASSGEHALELLAEHRPDLIILDVLMPGMGGFEACRRIRSMPETTAIPVLFMTALGDRDTTAPALEVGADDLLAKPFVRSELLLRVRALIRQRRLCQAAAEQRRACVGRLRQLVDLEGDLGARLRRELDCLEELL